jgi:hypothetical protein
MSEPVNLTGLDTTVLGATLLAGRLIVTLQSKASDTHIGLELKCWAPGRSNPPLAEATRVYVNVARSWDKVATINLERGMLYPDVHADPCRLWVLRKVLAICRGEEPVDTGQYKVMLGQHCARCGAELSDPDSIETVDGIPMGPDCAKRVARFRHQVKSSAGGLASEPREASPQSGDDAATAGTAQRHQPQSGLVDLRPGESLDDLYERMMQS